MNIGNAVKHIRTQRGLTQKELAALVDIDKSYLSLLETNKRNPSFALAQRIAEVLDVPLVLLVFVASSMGDLENIHDSSVLEKLALEAKRISE